MREGRSSFLLTTILPRNRCPCPYQSPRHVWYPSATQCRTYGCVLTLLVYRLLTIGACCTSHQYIWIGCERKDLKFMSYMVCAKCTLQTAPEPFSPWRARTILAKRPLSVPKLTMKHPSPHGTFKYAFQYLYTECQDHLALQLVCSLSPTTDDELWVGWIGAMTFEWIMSLQDSKGFQRCPGRVSGLFGTSSRAEERYELFFGFSISASISRVLPHRAALASATNEKTTRIFDNAKESPISGLLPKH
jgi:hypothetical protein